MKDITTIDNVKLDSIKRKASFYKMHSDTINIVLFLLGYMAVVSAIGLLLAGAFYGLGFLCMHYILARIIIYIISIHLIIGFMFFVLRLYDFGWSGNPLQYLFLSPYLSIWKYFKSRTARRNRYYIPLTIDELRSNNINTVGEYLDNTKNLISWKDGKIVRQARMNEDYKNSIYMNIPNVFEGINTTFFSDVMEKTLQNNEKILGQEEIRTKYCKDIIEPNIAKKINDELDRLFGCTLKEE